jgi:hypothetical protein
MDVEKQRKEVRKMRCIVKKVGLPKSCVSARRPRVGFIGAHINAPSFSPTVQMGCKWKVGKAKDPTLRRESYGELGGVNS